MNYWDVKNGFKISVHSRIRVSFHDFHCLMKKVTLKQNNDDKSESNRSTIKFTGYPFFNGYSLLSRDVTSGLSVQMVVKGK